MPALNRTMSPLDRASLSTTVASTSDNLNLVRCRQTVRQPKPLSERCAGRTRSPWPGNQVQPTHIEKLYAHHRFTLNRFVAAALLLTCAACNHMSDTAKPTWDKHSPRAQLSIGYSLLYQEADGIPKLKWILMFKDKPEEMGRLTNDLVGFYQQLADTMQRLSKQFPGMRIDVAPTSEIESDERKAIGADLAKDFAPLVGKTGIEFEREALLMFYNTLDEQRHLTGVMVERETDPNLRKFLETTKAQLETRYAKVGALLNRRYFTQ
jgi:hypothetical protein